MAIFSSVGTATLKNTTGKWYLHVQAKDAAGNISDMITVSAELSDEIINRPPSDLNIETATDKYIKLSWDYYYDHSQITYNVYKSEMPDGYYYQINTKPIRNGERFIDDYIDPQKSYYYKVKSILNGQESDFSHYIQATPQHQADFDIHQSNFLMFFIFFNNLEIMNSNTKKGNISLIKMLKQKASL